MRYAVRHSQRVMDYITSNKKMPRRVRRERARIMRLARRKGIIQ